MNKQGEIEKRVLNKILIGNDGGLDDESESLERDGMTT